MRIFLYIYERKIRARFPKLPSIQRLLLLVSTFLNTVAIAVEPHVPDPTKDLPILDPDLDAIKRGKS